MQVTITINGQRVSRDVEPRTLLVHFIRDTPGLTGTHWGCDTSNCGACVVMMDGKAIKSCTTLAAMCEGHEIRTVESLEVDGVLDPIQQGFHEKHALHCGFWLPGMVHGAMLRSPFAHARIVSIDTSRALAHPGVAAVVTAKDLETLGLAWMPTISYDTQAALAGDKVRFQGQEVACVIATDEYSARDALG